MEKYTEQQVFDRVAALARECVPSMKNQQIMPDTKINFDSFESLNFIMLICKIEGEYGIKIPDKVWPKLKNVQEVVTVVTEYANNKKQKN